MTVIWAERALTAGGWRDDVAVTIESDGRIGAVSIGAAPCGHRVGCLLPAPANAHSHAFQRAMAGLTEGSGPGGRDSFWTWRELMFRFLDRLDPDQLQAIAAFVQMEMLEAGYAVNVEFHYLHHRPGGGAYDNLAEMSERIIAACDQSGGGLTLLPVLYQYGGCDGRPLGPGQQRFGNDLEQFAKLAGMARSALRFLPADAGFGVAPHSLRAVAAADLPQMPALAGGGVVHMHLAEQLAEVAEVEAHLGARPVQWALNNLELGPRWCLIHCTQMQPDETTALATTGAVAGLCPITEASLGDGIFDGRRWLDAGGRFAIGSDSNIRVSLAEELRTLEYSQRLRDHARAVLAAPECSTGRQIFQAACEGGARAAGRESGVIAAGKWADLLALDLTHVDLAGRDGDGVLDSYIFAGDDRMITDVWSAGRHMVRRGRHIEREAITRAYRDAVQKLRELA